MSSLMNSIRMMIVISSKLLAHSMVRRYLLFSGINSEVYS